MRIGKSLSQHEYFEYRWAVAKNRELFLLAYSLELKAFLTVDDGYEHLAKLLAVNTHKDGHDFATAISFVNIMRRQTRNAFETLSSAQSYQAWVLYRPCLECALMLGKFYDDPKNADTWAARDQEPTAYREAFKTTKLNSTSLPRSAHLRDVLNLINDDFMHLNPTYYKRHTSMDDDLITIDYFDDDWALRAHLLAFLHLSTVLFNSTAEMLTKQFAQSAELDLDAKQFRKMFKVRVKELLNGWSLAKSVLQDFGLWPNQAFEAIA